MNLSSIDLGDLLAGLAAKLKKENDGFRAEITHLENRIKANDELVTSVTKRLHEIPSGLGVEAVGTTRNGQGPIDNRPFTERMEKACLSFGDSCFTSKDVRRWLRRNHALSEEENENVELIGNYLWKMQKTKKITVVERGAGKRLAKYRNTPAEEAKTFNPFAMKAAQQDRREVVEHVHSAP